MMEGEIVMNVSFQAEDHILLIHMDGELDHHSAELVKKSTDEQIESNKIRDIVFNFKNVRFMDSSGVGFVMGRYKKIQEAGGRVAVIGTDQYINRILEMSGIYTIAAKQGTYEEAKRYILGKR